MKKLAIGCAAALAAAAGAADTTADAPEVSEVTMAQGPNNRLVTINYSLSAEAVVTLDVQTNAVANASTGWTSIGGEAIWNAAGDVWKKVSAGSRTITWRPDLSWRDENGNGFKIGDGKARAVVTAWALDNTPDYMVVDISESAAANSQKYYPGVDYLPGLVPGQNGAITNNPEYKTSKIVMRKIAAKDVEWTMGSGNNDPKTSYNIVYAETEHTVKLENNYYIGVFEITQGQWGRVYGGTKRKVGYYTTDNTMRPMDIATYNMIRLQSDFGVSITISDRDAAEPFGESYLGRLRTRTGLDFDLPSEAQWEFAARAGNSAAQWGNGTYITGAANDANLMVQARCAYNSGDYTATGRTSGTDAGTAIVGSYAPNSWGLYDVHGNVWEWCRDGAHSDITSNTTGAPMANASGNKRILRGGSYAQGYEWDRCRATFRRSDDANYPDESADVGVNVPTRHYGFRVICTAGLD